MYVSFSCIADITVVVFFFNDTATTEIYTLSLHDALPISGLVFSLERNEVTELGGRQFITTGSVSGQGQSGQQAQRILPGEPDRKSTRLNSSHANISYAVFCLKKKNHIKSIR